MKYNINRMNCNREKVKLAASLIEEAFIWSNSEEGISYWDEVFNKLKAYAHPERRIKNRRLEEYGRRNALQDRRQSCSSKPAP